MPKLKVQMKPKVQMTKLVAKLVKKEILTLSRFGIHLTFGL